MFYGPETTQIEERLAAVTSALEAESLDGGAAVELFDRLDRIERLAAAGKALVAGRIEATGAWRGQGARDAVGFLAARARASRARVRDGMEVAARLEAAPVLARAFRTGELTIDQAADIAAAVAEHPETEAELIALAGSVSARELKARCVEILAQGEGAEEQHRRARAERSASASTGRDGIWRLSARLPIIDGAFVDKALDHFQTQIFDAARRHGERDPFDAYRADALVAMAQAAMGQGASGAGCDGTCGTRRQGRRSSIRHAIVVTVPHTAFGAGGLGLGETCRVPGVGPVPVSVVQQLLDGDPIIKAVVTRGRDITAVATLTRTVKEDLRLAVLAASDLTCAVPGCTNTRFLQLDHEHEFHKGGPTSFDNLRPLCTFHHNQRTREGYELQGSPGCYRWLDPDGNPLAADPPPAPPPTRQRDPGTPAEPITLVGPTSTERSARLVATATSPP